MRFAAGGVTTWITAQAVVNIGAVLGLLPIAGVPLPLFSYGGSALLPTMFAIGLLISFARSEPGSAGGAGRAGGRSCDKGMSIGRMRRLARRRPSRRAVNFGACRTRRRRDRRSHRARARPRGRPAQAGPHRGDHRARHRTRPGDQTRPRARLRTGADPRRPAAPPAHPGADHRPRTAARHHQGRRADPGAHQGGLRRRLRRLRGAARLPGRQAARRADRGARGQRPPGPGQQDRLPVRVRGRRLHPGQQAARRPLHRHPAAPHHRHPGPGRGPPGGPRAPSGSTRTCRPCWSPAARRAPGGSTRSSQAIAPRLQQSGVQILHAVGPKNELRGPRQHARHAAVRPGALPGPDGSRLRRRRHDAVPGRRDDGRRTVRGRTARPPTSRCRSATASSGSTPSRWSRRAADCWWTTRN